MARPVSTTMIRYAKSQTRIQRADDNLSRAASALVKANREFNESMGDINSFGTSDCEVFVSRSFERQVERIAQDHEFVSKEHLITSLSNRVSYKWFYLNVAV